MFTPTRRTSTPISELARFFGISKRFLSRVVLDGGIMFCYAIKTEYVLSKPVASSVHRRGGCRCPPPLFRRTDEDLGSMRSWYRCPNLIPTLFKYTTYEPEESENTCVGSRAIYNRRVPITTETRVMSCRRSIIIFLSWKRRISRIVRDCRRKRSRRAKPSYDVISWRSMSFRGLLVGQITFVSRMPANTMMSRENF